MSVSCSLIRRQHRNSAHSSPFLGGQRTFARGRKLSARCRKPSQPRTQRAWSSAATGRSSRSAAAARARSGSRATSARPRGRAEDRPAEGRPARAPSGRRRPPRSCGTRPACAPTRSRATSEHVYIAYEYVPGRTLREALARGELDDRGAVEAAAQILDGLAHAHAHGIVHRDVKPSNVLLADGPGVSVAAARLRAGADRRGGDPDRGRRRAGHARLHLARAAARRRRRARRPTSGRSA